MKTLKNLAKELMVPQLFLLKLYLQLHPDMRTQKWKNVHISASDKAEMAAIIETWRNL